MVSRLTTNQEIAGSRPAVVISFLPFSFCVALVRRSRTACFVEWFSIVRVIYLVQTVENALMNRKWVLSHVLE